MHTVAQINSRKLKVFEMVSLDSRLDIQILIPVTGPKLIRENDFQTETC
jgi:hypothetical protein